MAIIEGWCIFVTLDIKNAFNTTAWVKINEALKSKVRDKALIELIARYLEKRYVSNQDLKIE